MPQIREKKKPTLRVVDQQDAPAKQTDSPKLNKVKVQKTSQRGDNPSLLAFTLYFLYKNLYILGITLLRRRRKYVRRTKLFLSKMRGSMYAGLFHASQAVRRLFRRMAAALKAPFLRIRNVYREQKPIIKAKREKGVSPFSSYLEVAEAVLRLLGRIAATIVNHVLPVAAVLVLGFLINGFINQNFGLRVIYKDELIGYIKSESDFDAAARDVQSRVIAGTDYTFPTEIPSYEVVICEDPNEKNPWILQYNNLLKLAGIEMVEVPEFTDQSVLADSIIRMSGQEVEEAYGLYIDNNFIGALENKDRVLNLLDSMRRRSMSGKPGERVEFEKGIELTPKGLYMKSTLRDEDEIIETLTSNELEDQFYEVQEGDTPTEIAAKTGISYSLLKEMNPDIEESLMPGDQLRTVVAKPFLTIKSIYTDTYTEEIPFETEEIQNALYAVGYQEVKREGQNGTREVTAEITAINGVEASRTELSSRTVVEPVSAQVEVGVNTPAPTPAVIQDGGTGESSGGSTPPAQSSQEINTQSVSQTGFMWPTSSGYVSCGLGGYPGHTGVDIAGPAGTPIYASASGYVTRARFTYYGYGIHCIINHGNGYETVYAHMSDMYVSVGDQVSQGQIIGMRGRTGNASGNHLHFEVRVNGSYRNPLDYISQ